jgi:hypothetical protein
MKELFREGGLARVELIVLNYESGRRETWTVGGNLLYVLKAETR